MKSGSTPAQPDPTPIPVKDDAALRAQSLAEQSRLRSLRGGRDTNNADGGDLGSAPTRSNVGPATIG